MKIAVISSTVFPIPVYHYSGLEHLAWQIAGGLAKLGHEVYLLAPDGSSCPGCQMVHFGPAGGTDEKSAYGGSPELRDQNTGQIVRRKLDGYWQLLLQVDVIIDHSWQKWSHTLKLEGRLKAPILGVTHAPVNTMFQSLPAIDKPCFVCISQDQVDHFKALWNKEARVCYNGVDSETFYRPLDVPRSNRFLFLARFSSIKGADLAAQACLDAGVGLDLIGDSSITQEPEYLANLKKVCDGKQIRMIGSVNRGECVYWFSQAHCLLHPNQRFREPFGLAPVEAMCCGCPVIAWDYGAMRETVVYGGTGWLVNSYDELVMKVKQAANLDLTIMREHARQHAQQFTVDRMVLRYAELCREAVDSGGW